jgi:predicted dehydrogenase
MGAAVVAAGPYAASSPASPGPNDVINVGLIGCGARGRGVITPLFKKQPGVRFTAVCDVNSKYMAQGRKLAGGDGVKEYKDYRKLLEDKSIDVVAIVTNQHWHALPAIAACQAGKDVYLEKPMGNFIGEGRFVIDAARKYKRIVQMGTQQRFQEHYKRAVEVIQSGKLGQISEVKVWDYENNTPGFGAPADTPPPPELDWDFFVGPSAFRPYNPNMYFNYGYDWFRVSGAGHQVAWGVHHFDVVLWAMGVKAPRRVTAFGGNYAFQDNRDWPNTFTAIAEFGPGPVSKNGFVLQYEMRVGSKRETRAHSKCFLGTEASMQLDRVGYVITSDFRRGPKGMEPPKVAEEVLSIKDDMIAVEGFFKNVRERKQPAANPETCHLATNVGHLMNIAWQTGRTIRWDAEKEQAIGDAEANKLAHQKYRAPWKLAV